MDLAAHWYMAHVAPVSPVSAVRSLFCKRLGSEGGCAPHAIVGYIKGSWLQKGGEKAGLEVCFYIVAYML